MYYLKTGEVGDCYSCVGRSGAIAFEIFISKKNNYDMETTTASEIFLNNNDSRRVTTGWSRALSAEPLCK